MGAGVSRDHFKEVAVAREATLRPPERAAAKLTAQRKLYVRDRLALLFDPDTFVEDAQLANALTPGLPAVGTKGNVYGAAWSIAPKDGAFGIPDSSGQIWRIRF